MKSVPWQGHGCHAWRTEERGFCSDGRWSEKVWWERRSWSTRLKRTKRWSGEGIGSGPSSPWATLSLFRRPFVISSHPPTPTLIIKTILCLFPPALEKSVSGTQLLFWNPINHILGCQKVLLGFSISSYELFGQPKHLTVFYLVLCYLDATRKQRN